MVRETIMCAILKADFAQVYVSGNTLIILRGPTTLTQTILHGPHDELQAVSISESSGKIATCTRTNVFVYKPYGLDEGDLKVGPRNGEKIRSEAYQSPVVTTTYP